ncbi:MAG: response regulator transcription factor [Clostridia bacterium]|nr:response regulator transcription factor [Clostridia bacterium]
MPGKILIVEDDSFIREGLCELLGKEEYSVFSVANKADAEKALSERTYNLIILDNMLPDGTGLNICTELRNKGIDTPVLFLTACDDEMQIVQGLDAGADDYVTKPFRIRELFSRVKALMRRTKQAVYSSDGLTVDMENMTVRKDGEIIFVTPTEFHILSSLIKSDGIIVTRESLLRNIWDDNENYIDDNTLSVHISRLREKIGAEHIVTIRGIGYRWEE